MFADLGTSPLCSTSVYTTAEGGLYCRNILSVHLSMLRHLLRSGPRLMTFTLARINMYVAHLLGEGVMLWTFLMGDSSLSRSMTSSLTSSSPLSISKGLQ